MIDLLELSKLPIKVKDDCSIEYDSNQIIIDESKSRKLLEMKHLFKNCNGYCDETDLYYMYNGIYKKEDEEIFKKHNARYEYTILSPMKINNEKVKSFGHIHNINPLTNKRFEEAYEVLYGKGCFQLFRIFDEEIEVSILDVKVGDKFVVPTYYYHLSINTGDEPFIFGDLILDSASSDYSFLDKMNGAPFYFGYNDKFDSFNFEQNPNYKDYKVSIRHITVDEINKGYSIPNSALYSTFIENPNLYDFVLI